MNERHICRDRAHRRSTCKPPATDQQPLGMPRPLGAVEMHRGRWAVWQSEKVTADLEIGHAHEGSPSTTHRRSQAEREPRRRVQAKEPTDYTHSVSRPANDLVSPGDADGAEAEGRPPSLSGIHSDPRTGPAARTYFSVMVIPAIYWLPFSRGRVPCTYVAPTRAGSSARWLSASSPRRVGAGGWLTRNLSAMGLTACRR